MAKKIMALVTAIALVVCFAVSASAVVNVATTTQYVSGSTDIKVNVTVTGTEGEIAEGTNVTYYATKAGADVHIDQAKATASGAAFEFNTAATNLESTVKVGYTGASAAEDADITGYTVTYPNGSKVVPTAATTVTITYTPTSGKVFSAVTSDDIAIASATPTANAGEVSVTFGAALTGDVTLTVVEDWAPAGTVTATAGHVESAAVVVALAEDSETYNGGVKLDGVVEGEGDNEVTKPMDHEDTIAANADKVGDRKLTVIGQVSQTNTYGIIVSTTAIETTNVGEAEFNATYKANAYAGATKNDAGIFAIQLIDTSVEAADAFVKAGETYYTAVYAQDATGAYVITAGATVVVD